MDCAKLSHGCSPTFCPRQLDCPGLSWFWCCPAGAQGSADSRVWVCTAGKQGFKEVPVWFESPYVWKMNCGAQ